MARGRSRRSGEYAEFWPGYVDVLSTLLLVVTFLMSVFMIAQFNVSQELGGKDTALRKLTRQISELTNLLSLEKDKGKKAEDDLSELQAALATLRAENDKLAGAGLGTGDRLSAADAKIMGLNADIAKEKDISAEALSKVEILNAQLLQLNRQLAALKEALDVSEAKNKDSQVVIKDMGAKLNAALAQQVQELRRYRSDFFGRLRTALADRKDIRVVGDRFVFQSEVLFPSGQATMSPEGLGAIDKVASALVELERTIPPEVDWVLQVDGHTDVRPISSALFPSNWELSTARAASVVKYLISRGVPARRLVAAGYGEFAPLDEGTSEESLRRNRRIELKLTSR